jgi:hypothetical protein
MSPHGIVLLAALLPAFFAKLAFPQWTLRIVATLALGLPLALIAVLGESPSLLGALIVAPITLVGAALGVAAGALANRLRHKLRHPR